MTLPLRWTPLRYHPEQSRLWNSQARFIIALAGRRSGKTEINKRKLVLRLAQKTMFPDANYFAAAPTFNQAKKIFWKDFKALVPKRWVKRVYESDLAIETVMGSTLFVVGLDKPQRIEGSPWDGGMLDEYADMKPEVWSENIRPLLSDRNGFCWFSGVPEGLNHYYDLWNDKVLGKEEGWEGFYWKSADILPPKEIETAKRDLDARTFRQEYEASFEDAQGQVYYAYSEDNQQDIKLDPKLPIILCVDFNVDPCIWIVAQSDGHKVYCIDEIHQLNTNTPEMTREYLKRYGKYDTIVYGDSSGSSRSTAGKSDYAIMAEMGLRKQNIKKANPRVKDRVNAMNKMLCNAKGERRLLHSPKCVELRKDLLKVVWKGQDINKSDIKRTHSTDALGYYIEYEYGHNVKRASGKAHWK